MAATMTLTPEQAETLRAARAAGYAAVRLDGRWVSTSASSRPIHRCRCGRVGPAGAYPFTTAPDIACDDCL